MNDETKTLKEIESSLPASDSVDKLYESLSRIVGDDKITESNIVFIATNLMQIVEKYPSLNGSKKKALVIHVLKRFVILFVLGMVAQGHLLEYDLSKLHIISNTLQAIAIGYLIAALIMLNMKVKWQVSITAGMLLLFWGLMAWIPVSGYGAGSLTPDGNLAISIDKWILGSFQDGTTYSWILSGLTFACTVLLGVFAGYILRSDIHKKKNLLRLTAFGFFCTGLGLLWSLVFPIIKHIWTSSFVLLSGGICILLLALFYLVIDVWGWRKWAFVFKVIGMNAIGVYMVTRLFDFRVIANVFVGGLVERLGTWNALFQGMAGFAVIWLILYFMYTKKIFIKI